MQATRICSVDGCDRDARKRDWCGMHYDRLRRRGEIELLPALSVAERLAAGLVRMPNGCLEWTGSLDHYGYGQISADGGPAKTHRLAWILVNGPIPDGMCVLHHCDNPPCCDAKKCLFLGTKAENSADMAAKKRSSNGNENKTHCSRNHPYTDANTYVAASGRRDCRACMKIRAASYD